MSIDHLLDKIMAGDSLELIKQVPDKSVDLVICSPPYFNQREYTDHPAEIGREQELSAYLDKLLVLFKQCVRVVADDGHLIFNMGDKYVQGNLLMVPYQFAWRACKEAKVKLINQVTWIKTNPTPHQYQRRLVNSTEPFFDFVKSEDYFYNLGVFQEERKPASKSERIGQSYFQQIAESDLTEEQKQLACRELQEAIDEIKAGKLLSLRMKIMGKHALPYGGQEGGRMNDLRKKGFTIIKMPGRIMQKDIIECPVESVKWNKHPAMYPTVIVERFLKLTTREGDVVLDPFMGAGTTACACKKWHRHYIGFELCQEYIKQSLQRIAQIGLCG